MSPLQILQNENRSLRAELEEVRADLDLADEINFDEVQGYKEVNVFYIVIICIQFACLLGLLF